MSKNRSPNSDWLTGGVLESPVTVGTTAVPLPATAHVHRRHIEIFNNSGSGIFLGGAGVTITRGIPLPNGGNRSFSLDVGVLIYAIAASNNLDIRVLEGW